MAETKHQLHGWTASERDQTVYPYIVNQKGKFPDNDRRGRSWELIAEGTKEQMLAYWKLLDPVSWAKETEGKE